MSTAVAMVSCLYLLLVAVLALAAAAGMRCRPAVATGVLVAEGVLVAQAALDLISMARGHRPGEPATHAGYLIVSVGLLPLLIRFGDSTPDRGSMAVTALACAVAVVVVIRLQATWQ